MKNIFSQILEQASAVILDKKVEINLALVCLLAKGHLLIEDQPGVGKTTLVQVLAKLCGLTPTRIQFTSDLLPADILGNSIWHEHKRVFEFHPGPLFSQAVLADELNRASPRTQSALLQAMEEAVVTIDGIQHSLPQPFFVIATQNPNSQIGTFPLPESQLDRFLMSLELRPASAESEKILFQGKDPRQQIAHLKPLITNEEFIQFQNQIENIILSEKVAEYIYALISQGRKDYPQENLSTRSGMAIAKAAKALAFLKDRKSVTPDEVQQIAVSVLAHRLCTTQGIKKGQQRAEALLQAVAVPI